MAGGLHLSDDAAWLDARTAAAPPALRGCVARYVAAETGPLAPRLAAAGRRALAHVVAHPGDRSVALDLLAADGLVTLALLAHAEREPETLRQFSRDILDGRVGA